MTRDLSRRSFLRLAGATAIATGGAATLAACGSSGGGGGDKPSQLVVAGGGGALTDAYRKAYYEPYTKKTGIKIVEATNDAAKLRSMVQFGDVEWDVAQLDPVIAASAANDHLLTPLDYAVIQQQDLQKGLATKYYLPCDIAALVVAWNTKAIGSARAPSSWHDLLVRGRFSGRRGLWKQPSQTLEVALLADGVKPDRLYPVDVDRALHVLDPIKSNIQWWTSGAQSAQQLISRDVSLSAVWNGRVQPAKDQGEAVDFTFADSLLVADAWAVPKGTKNAKTAMEFIAFCMRADNQANLAKHIPYGPVNTKAFDLMDDATKAKLPNAPGKHYARVEDFDWWAAHQDEVMKRWNDWLAT